jgi:hypothetical protein
MQSLNPDALCWRIFGIPEEDESQSQLSMTSEETEVYVLLISSDDVYHIYYTQLGNQFSYTPVAFLVQLLQHFNNLSPPFLTIPNSHLCHTNRNHINGDSSLAHSIQAKNQAQTRSNS